MSALTQITTHLACLSTQNIISPMGTSISRCSLSPLLGYYLSFFTRSNKLLHSYFFTRESPQFRERMAGAECARSSAHDGRTDQTAIPVKNISVKEFSQLLWIFYNSTYIYNASSSIWGSILSLSSPDRWDFPRMHALALHNLNNLFLSTVDRIVVYTKCSVSFEHLLLLYVELCTREASLSLEESIRLGSNLVVPIWQIRESLLRGEGKIEAADATQDNGTAAAGIPEKCIRDQIRYRLNATQDISSMMDTHKHYCLLHHEFDLHRVQTRVEKRERHTNGPQPKEKSTVSNTGSSNQALHQKHVMKTAGKRKAAANAKDQVQN